MLKTEVVAAVPNVNAAMIGNVNPGSFQSCRTVRAISRAKPVINVDGGLSEKLRQKKCFDSKIRIVRPWQGPGIVETCIEQLSRQYSTWNAGRTDQYDQSGWVPNLAPMSSAWWLGWTCMLGLGQMGQTSENLIRTGECVINLPSEGLVAQVDRLAMTTGRDPVPEKNWRGGTGMRRTSWRRGADAGDFGIRGSATRAGVPCTDGGIVNHHRPFGKNVSANVFEVHITRLHVDDALLTGDGPRPHIDPERWKPLMMSFCRFFGLAGEVHPSRLADRIS